MRDLLLLDLAYFFIGDSKTNMYTQEVEPGVIKRFSKESIRDILRRRYLQLLEKEKKLNEYEALIKAINKKEGD